MFNIFKGWLGEKTTQLGMWINLDSKIYKRFHDLILTHGSRTTQIDHVVLSPYGLFVVETKNLDGWIFGSETGKVWTQDLHGSKRTFQNPLHQNYGHTKALAEHLQVDHSRVHSIVFFIGEAELKTVLPSNVMTSGLSDYVERFRAVVFSAAEMAWIEDELSRARERFLSLDEGTHRQCQREVFQQHDLSQMRKPSCHKNCEVGE